MLTVTAVTNSGRSEVKAEDKVLANTWFRALLVIIVMPA